MRKRSDKTEARRLRSELRCARAVLVHVRDHGIDGPWGRDLVRNEIRDIDHWLAPRRAYRPKAPNHRR